MKNARIYKFILEILRVDLKFYEFKEISMSERKSL